MPKDKIEFSIYQKKIFKSFRDDNTNLIIEALAGSGKTTSLVEAFRYLPKGKSVLALAFNKSIKKELQSKVSSNISVYTFHSLGLKAITQRFGQVEIDDYKLSEIVSKQVDEKDYDLINNICDTINFCRYSLQDTPSQISAIINNFNIDLCDMDEEAFIKVVNKSLAIDKSMTSKIDYGDMCYYPFVYNMNLGNYDVVAVDEFQDLNQSNFFMAKKATNISGRMIFTGDFLQELYSWRGSDTTFVRNLQKDLNTTKTLSLPISYRCPKKVVELLKGWAPDIICPETNIDGQVKNISINEIYDLAKPGCFIISRTNAPLVKLCMSFIKLGVKANITGRDIGKQLGYLVKRSRKKQIPAFLTWLEKWKNKEVAELKARKLNIDNILDKYECLVNLCEDATNLNDVIKQANALFNDTDQNNVITLSTVHRAKGLQRKDVFLLKWTFRVWLEQLSYFDKPNEECNIIYVACSRAQERLFIVEK